MAQYASSGNRTPLDRLLTVLLSVVLLVPWTTASAAGAANSLFWEHEIMSDAVERQTVLTGHILGRAFAELAILGIDGNSDRSLRVYAFEGGNWSPGLDVNLGPDVQFVDVVNVGGSDRLIAYANGRLNWFDPRSATLRALVAVSSNFSPPRSDEVPHVDIARDINGDDLDDLIVPDVDGFWILVQLDDGRFAEAVKIGSAADMSAIYGADGYRYDPWSQSRIHQMDYNHDGRSDLLFWDGDHFAVHQQDEGGVFSPETRTFTTDVAFDTEQIHRLATGDMSGKALHSIADLNGDGVGDLVVYSLTGRRIARKASSFDVHFGMPTADGGTVFSSEIGVTFQSKKRIQLSMEQDDFDGDGQIDLMITTIGVEKLQGSLWKTLKGAMGDDIRLDLEFYRMKDGAFTNVPDTIRTVALDGAPSNKELGSIDLDIALRGATHEKRKMQVVWPKAFNTNLLIGDVTGDGRSDLLIEFTFRGLGAFVGISGGELFAERSQQVPVMVPHDREYTWLVDLNRDGKQDIVMHHPFSHRGIHGGRMQPPGTEPHRVTTLIAR